MKIIVDRIKSDKNSTLSAIYIDGVFECFGLENGFREVKVPGETRIPDGIYPIKIRAVGGFHNRYSSKFGHFHKGMLHIQDVPNFTYILIHIGNTHRDTDGCLLVGQGADSKGLGVQSSTAAYKMFYRKVFNAASAGDLKIEFKSREGV